MIWVFPLRQRRISNSWYVVGVLKAPWGLIATFPGIFLFLIHQEIWGCLMYEMAFKRLTVTYFWTVFGKEVWSLAHPLTSAIMGLFLPAAVKFTSLLYVLLYRRSKFCSLQKHGKYSIIKSICLVRTQCSINNKLLLVHKGHEWKHQMNKQGFLASDFTAVAVLILYFFQASKKLKVHGLPHYCLITTITGNVLKMVGFYIVPVPYIAIKISCTSHFFQFAPC